MSYTTVTIFIKYKESILMLNRNKKFWMGIWNAVGGHIEDGEDIYTAAIREVREETGLKIKKDDLKYLADLEWFSDIFSADGTYCFLVETDKKVKTPVSTVEGVLDYKDIDWIMNEDNRGIVPDIPYLLKYMLKGTFSKIQVYYDKNDHLVKVIEKEGETKMDELKNGFKKAGYAAVGAGATVYEKGKEVYNKVAPHLNKVAKELNVALDELSNKGEEIINNRKNKEKETKEE